MKNKIAHSTQPTVAEAVKELQNQLNNEDTRLLLYFASPQYSAHELSEQMQVAFPDTSVVGCTSSGELISGKMLDNSIVAMSFNSDLISEVQVDLVENISKDSQAVDKAFDRLAQQVGTPMDQLDPNQYVGIVLIDGMCGCEERVNERIGDLTNIAFIGGSAGDDLKFEKTHVYAQGRSYSDAAVLMLLKPTHGFDILKTQSFQDSGKVLVVTEHDEAKREISQFNNQPAAHAYAEALGVDKESLADNMFKSPLGLMLAEDEPFVRSPRVVEGDKVLFYCNVKNGMELHLLESTDIVEDTEIALRKKQQDNSVGAIINFNCILRTLDLKQQDRTQEYADLFTNIPTVGFSTYGESYIGHINQTATMLLLNKA